MTYREGISPFKGVDRPSSNMSDTNSVQSYRTYRSTHLNGSGTKIRPSKGNNIFQNFRVKLVFT